MASTLRLAGAQLSRPSCDKSPRSPVRPASASMHESCLYVSRPRGEKSLVACPELQALKVSLSALQRDEVNQLKKYGGREPSARSARFAVELPQTPQHEKYSLRRQGRAAPPTIISSSTMASLQLDERHRQLGGVRFNKRTLRAMFKEIDRDGSGIISSRELILALRQHKSLLAMFCQIQGAELDASVRDRIDVDKDEVYRIKEILKEVDTDGSGTMEWAEFVEFFRRAGLLLEYKTEKKLNRTTLCADEAGDKMADVVDDARFGGVGIEGEESEDDEGAQPLLAQRTNTEAQLAGAMVRAHGIEKEDVQVASTRLFHTVNNIVDDQAWLDEALEAG